MRYRQPREEKKKTYAFAHVVRNLGSLFYCDVKKYPEE